MYDSNQKWWNSESESHTEKSRDHNHLDCDCIDCRISKLEGSFYEITKQIREFLREYK